MFLDGRDLYPVTRSLVRSSLQRDGFRTRKGLASLAVGLYDPALMFPQEMATFPQTVEKDRLTGLLLVLLLDHRVRCGPLI
jgi:hypothetical protein